MVSLRRRSPCLQKLLPDENDFCDVDDTEFARYIAIGSYNFPWKCSSFVLEPPVKLYGSFLIVFRNGNEEYIIDVFNGLFTKRHDQSSICYIDSLEDCSVGFERLVEFYKAIAHSSHDNGASLDALIESWRNETRMSKDINRASLGINGDWNILRWLQASYQYLQEHPDAGDEAKLVFAFVLTKYKMRSPLLSDMKDVELGFGAEGLFLIIRQRDSDTRITVKELDMEGRFDPGVRVLATFTTNERRDLDLDSQELQRVMSESRKLCQSSCDSHHITKIQRHKEVAKIKRAWWETALVWLYTFAALSFSIATPSLNLMERDNILERLVDGFTIASILLISFFGFFKLTSEDPITFRNRLKGIKVLKSMRDVCQYCNVNETMAKLLLDANEDIARWVSDYNTCAMDIKCSGSIQFERGCTPTEILEMGKMLLYNMETGDMRLYDIVRQRYRRAVWRSEAVVHVEENVWYGGWPGPKDVVVRGDVLLESHGAVCPFSKCHGRHFV